MFLLDTCTLLWLASDQSQLSSTALNTIAAGAGKLYVSSISAFEVGVKHRKGHLTLPLPPEKWFPSALCLHGLKRVLLTPRILLRATSLPAIHNDPMDRIIIATALTKRLIIATPDEHIRQYGVVQTVW